MSTSCWLPDRSRLPDRARGRRALFLDRDGVLVEDVHFLKDVNEIRLINEAVDALRVLQQEYVLVVVTNQSGVARGYFDEATVQEINRAIAERLAARGVQLDGVYYCPHHPDAACQCRKPLPGMLLQAAADWDLDLTNSYMLGDRPSDVDAGRAAGATPLLISARARADTWGQLVARHRKENRSS